MAVNGNSQPKILEITPAILNLYRKKSSVYFTKHKLLACYDKNYGVVTPANKIRYFRKPELSQYPLNLNDGYETFQERQSQEISNTIDITLKYIMSAAPEGGEYVNREERTMIYTRQGTLAAIMALNYEKLDNWTVRVSRYCGNIYMVKIYNEHYRLYGQLKWFENHHSRLEKILFAESPYELPAIHEPFDENISKSGVHRSSLGKYDIVYSGEIQGIIAEEEFEDFNDLEALNKCRFVLCKQVGNTLKPDDRRYLKYWLQAYLSNVNDIYMAYKNRVGIVEEPIEHKIVSDMPKKPFWEPKICTAFLHDFLEHVEKLMSNVNCLYTVYDFHYNPKQKVISYEIFKGKTENTFLTKEYIDYCQNESIVEMLADFNISI